MPHTTNVCALSLALWLTGCGDPPATSGGATPSASTTASASVEAPLPPAPAAEPITGGAIALAGERVLVADEERSALWSLALPLTQGQAKRINLPGPPAQIAVVGERVLVTIRDPGLLVALDQATLKETARVALAPDAWGLAVSADRQTAVVSSAWTHQVSAVSLGALELRWTTNVAREPRAVVIPSNGDRVYVSHAVGAALTRIDGLAGAAPKVKRVALPPSPSRAPRGETLSASFGMAAVMSPTQDRLFVARQALGALGRVWPGSWAGAGTVDALLLADDTPLAPSRAAKKVHRLDDFVDNAKYAHHPDADASVYIEHRFLGGEHGPLPFTEEVPFAQPAAMAYRQSTNTLLVASQGTDMLVELDALALEPALHRIKLYPLGAGYGRELRLAKMGAAPSAIALSPDETTAYVWCRASFDVLAVPLVAVAEHSGNVAPQRLRVGEEDPLLEGLAKNDPKRPFREAAAVGRRHFYNALDEGTTGRMSCNGCHPDGRDDGHVWLEVEPLRAEDGSHTFVGGTGIAALNRPRKKGETRHWFEQEVHRPRLRQTVMLAGRVADKRRFGWLAESEDLVARIAAGFDLHRWHGRWDDVTGSSEGRSRALAAFLLRGLVPPPRPDGELSETEKHGKKLFEDDRVGCAACHLPSSGYSNGVATKVRLPDATAGMINETGLSFLTPPLAYVGGTPPYLHDGSVATLEALIHENDDRMGKTNHLSAADRAALVAFLRTL
jgi:hypothetical protein